MKRVFLLAFCLLLSRLIFASWEENVPQTIVQPNGKIIHCLASGDEFFNWLHDADGYTIVVNPKDGFYYYGIRSGETVVASEYLVGEVNPAQAGLEKRVLISPRLYAERRALMETPFKSVQGSPTEGLVNSLCIYITFADDSVFTRNRLYFKNMWSKPDQVSVHDYFYQISYNKLDLQIYHFPISADTVNLAYKDIYPRRYYLPKTAANPDGYDGGSGDRERAMLKRAVEYVANQVPADMNLDMNNDGIIDNISFIITGSASAWNTLLWPHKTGFGGYDARINGSRADTYFLTLENGFGAGTMCHELGHVFGAPDLYHYANSGKTGPDAVGGWCLMNSSADPPQSICGFLKYKYNHWITDLPEITESGVYSLRPLSEPTHNLFKIKSPYSKSEYFVLEYRKKTGRYESSVPATGLLIYRINTGAGNGNAGGPPDEVYTYRPGGTITQVGSLGGAAFSSPSRTAINDKTDPFCFLYNGGQTGPGGLDLFNVSEAGDSISFEVKIEHLFPPSQLTYSAGTGVLDLTWKPSYSQDLKGYKIYRDGVLFGTTSQTTYRDNEIVDNVAYTYSVTALYDGQYSGESVKSNEITYTQKGILSLPYREDFELPNHGWKIKGFVEGFQWGDATSLEMQTDNLTKFLGANSVAAGIRTVCSDYAITPRLNLYGKSKVTLDFDYALKRWQQYDHLKIHYRKNKYDSWVKMVDLPISGVASGYKWTHYSIELPAGALTAEAQLGFQYDDGNDMGYGAAIDNVEVTGEANSVEENVFGNQNVELYPNPASDNVTLKMTFPGNPEVTLQVCDMSGKIFLNRKVRVTEGCIEELNLSTIPAGAYFVVISHTDRVIVKQLIKSGN